MKMFRLAVLLCLATVAAPAAAYIGPGAGISVIGSLLGLLATIVVAIGAILFWPVRRMLKRRKQRAAQAEGPEISEDSNA
ncbi:MAG: hypothetical protein QNJ40_00875 [Xanthomonadales bacterium]|nr:hypothetical protein [Xanthomonadales bacterium]